MYNNQQGGYTLPYQSRLDSLKPKPQEPFNPQGTALPLQRPGQMNTDPALPIPPKPEEDPMEQASQGDFYKSNQQFMQDPNYAQGFNELVTTAGALRDQISKGFMPDSVAQERIQNYIFDLRSKMAANMEQPEQKAQSAKKGALDEEMPDDVPMPTQEEIDAEMAAMNPAGAGGEEELTDEMLMEEQRREMGQEEGAPTDEEIQLQAMAEQQGQQQPPQPKPAVDPRYLVEDPQIQAAAQRNNNRALGQGDAMGNIPQEPEPTASEMANAEYNASAATVADQANTPKEWWKSDSFIYSMTRMALGLLDGEDPASAFMGANESYMMLSGMEKREGFRPDLERQGYSSAQIEEYIRTGESKVLREQKQVAAPKWSPAGGGMMMNTAGEVRAIPGYVDKSQQINPYQMAQLGLAERRQDWAENQPRASDRQIVSSDIEKDEQGREYETTEYSDGTTSRRALRSTGGRESEGERVRQSIAEAPDDLYIGAKGPNALSGDERTKIGYLQDTYRGSADYVRDVKAGKIKPADLNTLSSNVISAIVMDPKQWISGSLINSMTKDEQASLNRLKKIIDPIARARSGAAIGVQEMETYLSYLKNIHRQDGVGAQSRVGMVSTMSSLAPGTRKDLDFLQNVVLPRARDAQPGKNGNWNLAYLDDEGQRQVFEFKPGRFFNK